MNNQAFTEAKFQICSNASTDQIFQWEESDEKSISKTWAVDLDNFKNILVKKDLGDYYTLLLGYLSGQKHLLSRNSRINTKPGEDKDDSNARQNHLLELANMLRFLLDDSRGRINFLKINKVTADSFKTENERVLNSIKESLTERIERDFRALDGHIDQLTEGEATLQLETGQHPEWLIYWNNSRNYSDKDGKKLIVVSLDIADDSVYRDLYANDLITGAELKQLLINDYAFDHDMERELTQEFLNKVIDRNTPQQKPRGGQEKYYQAKRIMQVLTNVIWTEMFLLEVNIGNPDSHLKIVAKDYKFFFEVFDAWGLSKDLHVTKPKDYALAKKLEPIFKPDPEVFLKDLAPRLLDLKTRI